MNVLKRGILVEFEALRRIDESGRPFGNLGVPTHILTLDIKMALGRESIV